MQFMRPDLFCLGRGAFMWQEPPSDACAANAAAEVVGPLCRPAITLQILARTHCAMGA